MLPNKLALAAALFVGTATFSAQAQVALNGYSLPLSLAVEVTKAGGVDIRNGDEIVAAIGVWLTETHGERPMSTLTEQLKMATALAEGRPYKATRIVREKGEDGATVTGEREKRLSP